VRICGALLSIDWALLREYRALLSSLVARLRICGALSSECRALLRENRALVGALVARLRRTCSFRLVGDGSKTYWRRRLKTCLKGRRKRRRKKSSWVDRCQM